MWVKYVCVGVCVEASVQSGTGAGSKMPLSADRCQVTWGPNPLKRAEVGRGGSRVYVCKCGCTYSDRAQSKCMCVCVCVHEGVFVCLAPFTLYAQVHLG